MYVGFIWLIIIKFARFCWRYTYWWYDTDAVADADVCSKRVLTFVAMILKWFRWIWLSDWLPENELLKMIIKITLNYLINWMNKERTTL